MEVEGRGGGAGGGVPKILEPFKLIPGLSKKTTKFYCQTFGLNLEFWDKIGMTG